jgi:hypothetical protein
MGFNAQRSTLNIQWNAKETAGADKIVVGEIGRNRTESGEIGGVVRLQNGGTMRKVAHEKLRTRRCLLPLCGGRARC